MKSLIIHRKILHIALLFTVMLAPGFVLAAAASSTNYQITRDVMPGGGGSMNSTNYSVQSASGQSSAIGAASSTNYNAVGGYLAMQTDGAPTITGVWPGTGAIGETISVFIFGSGFDPAPAATEVYFNGVRQFIVQVVTEDMLIVRVTVDSILFGPVTVTTSGGTAVSPTDFGIPITGLQITGIWPGTITEGVATSVFIFGSEFDLTPAATEVYFNGIRQFIVLVVTPDMLIVRTIPTAAMTGPVTVTTPAGSVISSTDLVVVP